MKFRPLTLLRLPEGYRALVTTIACAVVAAGSAVAFLWLTNVLFDLSFVRFAQGSRLGFAWKSLVTILGTSLATGWLMHRFAREAAGSGIPQLKAAYWKDMGFIPWRPVLVKFVAGVLSLAGGASLGREGPTVYISGGVASNIAGYFGAGKRNRRQSAAIGAAAGLAAAFNTPLAAITFVLEEIIADLNSRVVGVVVLAAVMGAFVVYAVIGRQPAFHLPGTEGASWTVYFLVPLVAATAAMVGVMFQRWALGWRARIRHQSRVPDWLRPCVGALGTWVIGYSVFLLTGRVGIFGLGYLDLSSALNLQMLWTTAGLMVAAKLLATVTSYSWGGCGGIFSPTLFLGGLTGLFLGGGLSHWLPLQSPDLVLLATVGMSACFGAVVRAPFTALLIVFEMTHDFSVVPALMLGTIVSQAIAHAALPRNFYDALLVQDGHELIRIKPPRDLESWQNLPISALQCAKPVMLRSMAARDVAELLDQHPFERFPIHQEGMPIGIVRRDELIAAAAQNRQPVATEVARLCTPGMSIRHVSTRLIESETGMVLLVDSQGQLMGVFTLHDLVRTQAALTD